MARPGHSPQVLAQGCVHFLSCPSTPACPHHPASRMGTSRGHCTGTCHTLQSRSVELQKRPPSTEVRDQMEMAVVGESV